MRLLAAIFWVVVIVIPTGAQKLICFGNEPSWSISFNNQDHARLTVPGGTARDFQGRETRNDVLREEVWRGRANSGDPELVLFMREAPCNDGMSDDMHPMIARASLPDGSFLTGCCRIPNRPATGMSELEGASWRLVSLPGQLPATLQTLQQPAIVRFDSGKVSGFNGCNTLSGSYTLNGNRVQLGTLAVTSKACIEPAATIENTFNKMFSGTLSYMIAGNRLNLATASGTVLGFEREAQARLAGTWNVTGFNNGREAVVSPLESAPLTLTFDNGRVSGRSGCNNFTGSYTAHDNNIKIGTMASTRMACAHDVMVQEQQFLKALGSVVRWNIQGNELDMHRADDQRALTATQGPAPELSGTWTVTGFNNGREAVVSPILNTHLTLAFENGRVSGRAGCNTFTATFTTEGNSIKIGRAAVTQKMCMDNDVMTQEQQFLKALESVVKWSVQGNELDMHRADGQRALTAMTGQVK
jgi:heat shock protein HslJ